MSEIHNTYLWFPSCGDSKELYHRIVLIEKFKKDKHALHFSCCMINGISVFKDPRLKENEFKIGENGMGNKYIVSGNDFISIKTDSAVIKMLVNAIEEYI